MSLSRVPGGIEPQHDCRLEDGAAKEFDESNCGLCGRVCIWTPWRLCRSCRAGKTEEQLKVFKRTRRLGWREKRHQLTEEEKKLGAGNDQGDPGAQPAGTRHRLS